MGFCPLAKVIRPFIEAFQYMGVLISPNLKESPPTSSQSLSPYQVFDKKPKRKRQSLTAILCQSLLFFATIPIITHHHYHLLLFSFIRSQLFSNLLLCCNFIPLLISFIGQCTDDDRGCCSCTGVLIMWAQLASHG